MSPIVSGETLKKRYLSLLEEIQARAQKKHHDPSVKLCVVTKTADKDQIRALYEAGCRDFGENRLEVLEEKQLALQALEGIRWHFIGHFQSRKIPLWVKLLPEVDGKEGPEPSGLYLTHSVHDVACLDKLERACLQHQKKAHVLLQVNVSGEASKQGMSAQQWLAHVELLKRYELVKIVGLMTMAPQNALDEELVSIFTALKSLKGELEVFLPSCQELSMGMTRDWQVALACGATWLRLGSALFN